MMMTPQGLPRFEIVRLYPASRRVITKDFQDAVDGHEYAWSRCVRPFIGRTV